MKRINIKNVAEIAQVSISTVSRVLNHSANVSDEPVSYTHLDREKMEGFSVLIPGERTLHVRLDQLTGEKGQKIPVDTPYAIVIESESMLTVQYTRVDTTQAELAISTTMVQKGEQG